VRLFGGHAHQGFDFRTGKHAAMARQVIVFFDDAHGLIHGVLRAFDGQTSIVQMRSHLQNVFQHSYIFIESSEERFQLPGDVNSSLHPIGRLGCSPKWVADGFLRELVRLARSLDKDKLLST
jgi:hypothetical protein